MLPGQYTAAKRTYLVSTIRARTVCLPHFVELARLPVGAAATRSVAHEVRSLFVTNSTDFSATIGVNFAFTIIALTCYTVQNILSSWLR
jgi:hypothetical protein